MILTIIGWIMALIFAYLLFTQSTGAVAIGNSVGSNSNTLIRSLQGR